VQFISVLGYSYLSELSTGTWWNLFEHIIHVGSKDYKLLILYLSILLHWRITQVLITVDNAIIYVHFNNPIASDSLKLVKIF
jgi:hypothetical protein